MSAFRNRLRAARSGRRGTTALEFAFIAPVFLLLLVGIIEGSRYAATWIALRSATSKATRAVLIAESQPGRPPLRECDYATALGATIVSGSALLGPSEFRICVTESRGSGDLASARILEINTSYRFSSFFFKTTVPMSASNYILPD